MNYSGNSNSQQYGSRRNLGFRGPNDRGPKCQICYRFNYTAANCDQRYNHDQQPSANVASFYQSQSPMQAWFPDTGATCPSRYSRHSHADTYTDADTFQVGNANGLNIAHVGSSIISTPTTSFKPNDILHIPSLTKSLLSVQIFTSDNDVFFEFHLNIFACEGSQNGENHSFQSSNHGLYILPF